MVRFSSTFSLDTGALVSRLFNWLDVLLILLNMDALKMEIQFWVHERIFYGTHLPYEDLVSFCAVDYYFFLLAVVVDRIHKKGIRWHICNSHVNHIARKQWIISGAVKRMMCIVANCWYHNDSDITHCAVCKCTPAPSSSWCS